ncbi:unnamed protein product, partial [Ectocarpus sp. 8 AP-2014]
SSAPFLLLPLLRLKTSVLCFEFRQPAPFRKLALVEIVRSYLVLKRERTTPYHKLTTCQCRLPSSFVKWPCCCCNCSQSAAFIEQHGRQTPNALHTHPPDGPSCLNRLLPTLCTPTGDDAYSDCCCYATRSNIRRRPIFLLYSATRSYSSTSYRFISVCPRTSAGLRST